MTDIKVTTGMLTIALPGLTAIRIDTDRKVIAIDHVSGEMDGAGEFVVHDLRCGTYGDFHRLRPALDCGDLGCEDGQHITYGPQDPWRNARIDDK